MGTYLKFTLIDRPHIDPTTKRDCGGKIYPDIFNQKSKVEQSFERGNEILLKLNINAIEAEKIVNEDKSSTWIGRHLLEIKTFSTKDFKATILSEADAISVLKSWHLYTESPISGVTN